MRKKLRDRLNALHVIEHAIVLIRAVDVVAVQAETEQDSF
jgi:hypothetical protein